MVICLARSRITQVRDISYQSLVGTVEEIDVKRTVVSKHSQLQPTTLLLRYTFQEQP